MTDLDPNTDVHVPGVTTETEPFARAVADPLPQLGAALDQLREVAAPGDHELARGAPEALEGFEELAQGAALLEGEVLEADAAVQQARLAQTLFTIKQMQAEVSSGVSPSATLGGVDLVLALGTIYGALENFLDVALKASPSVGPIGLLSLTTSLEGLRRDLTALKANPCAENGIKALGSFAGLIGSLVGFLSPQSAALYASFAGGVAVGTLVDTITNALIGEKMDREAMKLRETVLSAPEQLLPEGASPEEVEALRAELRELADLVGWSNTFWVTATGAGLPGQLMGAYVQELLEKARAHKAEVVTGEVESARALHRDLIRAQAAQLSRMAEALREGPSPQPEQIAELARWARRVDWGLSRAGSSETLAEEREAVRGALNALLPLERAALRALSGLDRSFPPGPANRTLREAILDALQETHAQQAKGLGWHPGAEARRALMGATATNIEERIKVATEAERRAAEVALERFDRLSPAWSEVTKLLQSRSSPTHDLVDDATIRADRLQRQVGRIAREAETAPAREALGSPVDRAAIEGYLKLLEAGKLPWQEELRARMERLLGS